MDTQVNLLQRLLDFGLTVGRFVGLSPVLLRLTSVLSRQEIFVHVCDPRVTCSMQELPTDLIQSCLYQATEMRCGNEICEVSSNIEEQAPFLLQPPHWQKSEDPVSLS